MKIEANVSFHKPEGNVYGCDVKIDKGSVKSNADSILEHVSDELCEMFGHSFDYDDFEVTNMQKLLEELALEKVYWEVRTTTVNGARGIICSPLLDSTKDAELWRMKYIIENPDDYIIFNLRKENGKSYTTGIGCIVSEVWAGHELP